MEEEEDKRGYLTWGEELLVWVVDERLMTMLVEGLDVGVVAVHIAGATISVAGAGAARVAEERVYAPTDVRKDKRC